MRFLLLSVTVLCASAGCAAPADGVEDESTEGTNAQAIISVQGLIPFGFTFLDFTPENTMIGTLVDKNVAPYQLTLLSTDWFNQTHAVTVYLVSHDVVSGKAKYVAQTGPSLSRHLDCGDASYPSGGTLAPKGIVFTPIIPTSYSVYKITTCYTYSRKPPNPPACY